MYSIYLVIRTHIYIHTHIYMLDLMYMLDYMYIHTYIHMLGCMCVCVCMYIYIYIYIYMLGFTHTRVFMYIYVCVFMHIYTHIHGHTRVHFHDWFHSYNYSPKCQRVTVGLYIDCGHKGRVVTTLQVRLLLRQGADIDHSNYDGRTVLHSACAQGNVKVMHLCMFMCAYVCMHTWHAEQCRRHLFVYVLYVCGCVHARAM